MEEQQHKDTSKGTISLVLGILSLIIPLVGLILGILAIVFWNKQKKIMPAGTATAGMVCGILGIIWNGLFVFIFLFLIAPLAYFGALEPAEFLPNKCTLQSGLACLDHSVSSTQVGVTIQNSLGTNISNIVVNTENCGTDNSPSTLANGERQTYIITCQTPLEGEKYRGKLSVSYISDGLTHKNMGELYSTII